MGLARRSGQAWGECRDKPGRLTAWGGVCTVRAAEAPFAGAGPGFRTGVLPAGTEAMDPQPLVAVADVEASSRWYRALLGCRSGHGGPDYERLLLDGRIVLQLHRWDAHGHPHLGNPESKPHGNGVLLWYRTDALDAAVARARALDAEILEEPHVNPSAGHRECWLRDPDGYVVVLAGPRGELSRARRTRKKTC